MTTGGHPPPEYAQKSLYVQQPSLRAGVLWFINITELRPLIAVPSGGMLVKHKDGTGRHQLICAVGFTCIAASNERTQKICSWRFT